MKNHTKYLVTSLFLSIAQLASAGSLDDCLQQQFIQADDSKTIGEIRSYCTAQIDTTQETSSFEAAAIELEEAPAGSAIAERQALQENETNPFALLAYKPNYIIFSNNFSSPNEAPFKQAFPTDDEIDFQSLETKFQISLMVPVVKDLFNGKADLYAAYTQRSFWQSFNNDISAPFRDSNYEPETWLSFKVNKPLVAGFQLSAIRTGFVHQSNGRAGSISRSWNRMYADFIFEHDDWYVSFKPWWRLPEDSEDDDNADIEDYLGKFELTSVYKLGKHNLNVMVRNNLHANNNRGAVELSWSFPLTDNVNGYVQWFNGYGESLIDYNTSSNSLGAGIELSNWL